MALDTYANLQLEIAGYARRNNLAAEIKTFISLAEVRMKSNLRVPEMILLFQRSVAAAGNLLTLPTGFVELRSLYIAGNEGRVLQLMPTPALIHSYQTESAGEPRFYGYQAGKILVAPACAVATTFTLDCYAFPTVLGNSTATNAILTAYPNLYLFGALSELFSYTRHAERKAEFEGLFTRGMNEANLMARKLLQSGVQSSPRSFRRNASIP